MFGQFAADFIESHRMSADVYIYILIDIVRVFFSISHKTKLKKRNLNSIIKIIWQT